MGGLPAVVLELMFRHANHTVLQQAAWEFFDAVLRVPRLRAAVLSPLLEAVSSHFQGAEPGARATAFELFKVLERLAGGDQGMGSALKKSVIYLALVKGKVAEYRAALEASYGGVLQYPTEDEVQAFAGKALNRLGF
jgi:hypothetical protein